jgi:hypothetical protein
MQFVEESLRQNNFWLRIMKEHALFIRLALPCNETTLIREAITLEKNFENLQEQAKKIQKEIKAVERLNENIILELNRIIAYKSAVLKRLLNCNLGGYNYPLLIDHIRREAIRYRILLIRLQNNINILPAEEILQEEIFWLRIMGEHAHFIGHLLDPSESRLVNQSRVFAEEFEELRIHARSLESMEVPKTFENWLLPEESIGCPLPAGIGKNVPNAFIIPRLRSFNREAVQEVERIRNFKMTALNLIKSCTVLSIIPPLLADHVLREAQQAIEDLKIVELRLRQ